MLPKPISMVILSHCAMLGFAVWWYSIKYLHVPQTFFFSSFWRLSQHRDGSYGLKITQYITTVYQSILHIGINVPIVLSNVVADYMYPIPSPSPSPSQMYVQYTVLQHNLKILRDECFAVVVKTKFSWINFSWSSFQPRLTSIMN